MSANKLRIALIQQLVGSSKKQNLQRARELIKSAVDKGAHLVSLPESFNSPYGTKHFPEYAEPIPGESTDVLSEAARENNVFLIGGSIPEREGDKLYNTCVVFNNQGDLIAKHRKVHLFDINIPGKFSFKESETLSPGSSYTTFDLPQCKVGVAICYDLRFANMAQVYANRGCKLLVFPGAFSMATGPYHWELLLRSRAVDNQVYVAGASPATDRNAEYVAYGHSLIANPWGEVIASCEHDETIIYADIDLNYVDEVRGQVPITVQKRDDLYSVHDNQ